MKRLALLLLVGAASPVAGQTPITLLGRVYASDSGAGIQNAIVTVDGYGSTLTAASGGFRFDGVEPGEYRLEVSAFGYADATLTLSVEANLTVDVPLVPAPLALDSLRVDLETLDFDGRAVDLETGAIVMGADVETNQGHREVTDAHGHFDLDDVYEGVPLGLAIRAFGYLPLDATFVPDDEGRRVFDLTEDPVMARMIEVQVERLEARAGGRRTSYPRSMNRDDLARFANNWTLLDMLEADYPLRVLRRVACVLIDERQIDTLGPMRAELRRSYLLTTYPDEVERIEFLEFPGRGRPLQLRIYTRSFMQELVATNRPLVEPLMFRGVCR